MVFALVTGAPSREPEQRTAKSGQPFVTATLRVRDGNCSSFWRLFACDDGIRAEMLRLREGDALSVQGPMSASLWTPENGESRVNLSVIVDNVLAARQPKKVGQKPKAVGSPAPKPKRASLESAAGDGVDVFGDALPF